MERISPFSYFFQEILLGNGEQLSIFSSKELSEQLSIFISYPGAFPGEWGAALHFFIQGAFRAALHFHFLHRSVSRGMGSSSAYSLLFHHLHTNPSKTRPTSQRLNIPLTCSPNISKTPPTSHKPLRGLPNLSQSLRTSQRLRDNSTNLYHHYLLPKALVDTSIMDGQTNEQTERKDRKNRGTNKLMDGRMNIKWPFLSLHRN